ncbi:hypothetical protein BH10BAC1_BH10BAC1_20220 [soil metagenome]
MNYKKIGFLFACTAIISSASFAQDGTKSKTAQEPVKVAPAVKTEPVRVAPSRVEPVPASTTAPVTTSTTPATKTTGATNTAPTKPITAKSTFAGKGKIVKVNPAPAVPAKAENK